jgi:hypothetical protein
MIDKAVRQHPQLNKKMALIFIDSNDIIQPENPFIDIYDLMLAQGCPEFEHGIPDTIPKLKLY